MPNRVLRHFDNISLESEKIADKLDFTEIFIKTGPVHIEIGSGKGTFLVGQAPAFPHINFFLNIVSNKGYNPRTDIEQDSQGI